MLVRSAPTTMHARRSLIPSVTWRCAIACRFAAGATIFLTAGPSDPRCLRHPSSRYREPGREAEWDQPIDDCGDRGVAELKSLCHRGRNRTSDHRQNMGTTKCSCLQSVPKLVLLSMKHILVPDMATQLPPDDCRTALGGNRQEKFVTRLSNEIDPAPDAACAGATHSCSRPVQLTTAPPSPHPRRRYCALNPAILSRPGLIAHAGRDIDPYDVRTEGTDQRPKVQLSVRRAGPQETAGTAAASGRRLSAAPRSRLPSMRIVCVLPIVAALITI